MNALTRSPSPIPAARPAAVRATSTSKFESLPEELQYAIFDHFETVSQLQPLRLVNRAFSQRSEGLLIDKKAQREVAKKNVTPYLAAYLGQKIHRLGADKMLEQANKAFAALQESGSALEELSIGCLDQNSLMNAHLASQDGLNQSDALIKLFAMCDNVVKFKLQKRVLAFNDFDYLDISSLKQLQHLDLSFNYVSDEFFDKIFGGDLTGLRSFACPYGLSLTAQGAESFGKFVAKQSKLEVLNVSVENRSDDFEDGSIAELGTLASQGHEALKVLHLQCQPQARFWENFNLALFPALESLCVKPFPT